MDPKIKESLKNLLVNQRKIPFRLWRDVLWLQEDEKLGIDRQGRIHWKEKNVPKKKEERISSWKGFFIKKRGPWDEKWMNNHINDYLLLVNKETITARKIVKCNNAEIRSILLVDYGFQKFIEEMKGRIIHKDGDSELISLSMKNNDEEFKAVKVKDSSTGTIYILRVPPTVKRCREAIAWTFGMEEDEYNPLIET